MVQKGCKLFLAYVEDVEVVKPKVNDTQIVSEFLDIFLEELSRLPSNFKIEFGIEVMSGTTLVLIAHYHMATKDCKVCPSCKFDLGL